MKQLLTSPKFITISLAILALIIIPITLIEVQSQQNLKQNAETILWVANESASTVCATGGGGANINVSFTNSEAPSSSTAMNVIATDTQTGKSVNLGSITGGKTKTGTIATGKTSLNAGKVNFALSWTDGHSGTDTATANYYAVSSCNNYPTPTHAPTPTYKPLTPTPTTPPYTPTPTICPTLAPVKNVHIICPNCQLTPSPTNPSPTSPYPTNSNKY